MTLPARTPEQYVTRTHWAWRAFWWLLAPLDSNKEGLSLTRLLSAGIFWATFHLAHDWIDEVHHKGDAPGWAFGTFVTACFTLSVCTALGGKYVIAFVQSKFSESGK